jgi:hypothetical protein
VLASRHLVAELIDARRRHLRGFLAQADYPKPRSLVGHERPFGGFPDQLADSPTERQPVAPRMRLRDLHRIVFKL